MLSVVLQELKSHHFECIQTLHLSTDESACQEKELSSLTL